MDRKTQYSIHLFGQFILAFKPNSSIHVCYILLPYLTPLQVRQSTDRCRINRISKCYRHSLPLSTCMSYSTLYVYFFLVINNPLLCQSLMESWSDDSGNCCHNRRNTGHSDTAVYHRRALLL